MLRFSTPMLFALLVVTGCNDGQDDTVTDMVTPDDTTHLEMTGDTNSPAPPAKDNQTDVDQAKNQQAICELVAIGDSQVAGTIRFTQQGDTVQVRGTVTGLSPGQHGFHIHEKGDLSDKETGKSAGGHFNPTDQPHGRPEDEKRHVGDLGNIEANDDGTAEVKIDDTVISLNGEHSIVGRSLMIHEGEDKFTQPAGDAGGRVAFGLIEANKTE